jgi:hypothetical protein
MSGFSSKPTNSGGNGKSPFSGPFYKFHYDLFNGNWSDFDRLSIGHNNDPQVLTATGFANNSVDIELQSSVPNDYASIKITLGNIVDLGAWANTGAAGTVTSTSSSQGLLTLTDGKLSGSYSAMMSIDVTAIVAAANATIHMHITDSFQLSLTGTGYVGASIFATSTAGGTVVTTAPNVAGPSTSGANKDGQFDLARFAADVLNSGRWDIAFVASAPGESLRGVGSSVVTIAATAELAGGAKPKMLNFQDVDRSNISFNDTSTTPGGSPFGWEVLSPHSVSLFHGS